MHHGPRDRRPRVRAADRRDIVADVPTNHADLGPEPTAIDFNAFFAKYGRYVRWRLSRYTHDTDDLDDLSQAAWALVHRNIESCHRSAGDGLIPWLSRICRTVGSRWVRSRANPHQADREASIDACALVDKAETALDVLIRGELRREMFDRVLALPPRQRDVVIFRAIAGRSVRDTAFALGCAPGTVKASFRTALASLSRSRPK
jgi:RNA polymerase sigma factor (sigma-70 family)